MASDRQLLRRARALAAGALAISSALSVAPRAHAQSCTSADPSQWPSPSKPYFMVVVDTSGSMGTAVTSGTSNSCGYQHNRIGDARCAVKRTIQAFGGEVNFGLATYASRLSCPAGAGACALCDQNTGCFTNTGCTIQEPPGSDVQCGPIIVEPNINPALNVTTHVGGQTLAGTQKIHAGGLIAEPLVQDNHWTTPLNPSNFSKIWALVDNDCGNGELGASGNTPLGGVLYNMSQYFSGTYRDPFTGSTLASPIGPTTFNGQAAERACRSINVILITDGDETCDFYNAGTYPCVGTPTPPCEGLAVFEAGRLFNTGVNPKGQSFKVKTYVIGFSGTTTTTGLDHIAQAGGTVASYSVNNETTLAQALSNIVGASIKPEMCNNADDNCNGCVDEGFVHYCDDQTLTSCCAWKTPAQKTACGASACACCNWTRDAANGDPERRTCIDNYAATITPANPKGDTTLLPCVTPTEAQDSTRWLCYDPGDVCDSRDNNCVGGVDEGSTKCGNPAHCPQTEVCNGQDDDCNGAVDEGNVCQNTCLVTPSAEVCDGCDNDCDGLTDNGLSVSIACGYTGPGEPAYCAGTITCKPSQAVPKGGCDPSGGFTACAFGVSPLPAETCNGLDDDCNGVVDDNITGTPCVPTGAPSGLVYNDTAHPTSACRMGSTQCVNGAMACVGWVGPSSTEICDGIDNDCDGQVDEGVGGLGLPCGVTLPPCTGGTTACVNGAITCQGGTQAQPERCDGIDNDCNGIIDDGVLSDAPPVGQNGCWTGAGTCCSYPAANPKVQWCPPTGATCNGLGSLTSPCSAGTLSCTGGTWICKGPTYPATEVCDGIDNDCNGQTDDGLQNLGTVCGTDVGECKKGVLGCAGGVLTCVGGVSPTQEQCDGKDNDCDGTIDNGIPTGGACLPDYDTALFPGPRTSLPCRTGVYQCDGAGGLVCVGGVGPQAEICDGIDNDCDGQIDEVGNPPDGINGTANPFAPPAANIGDPCGVSGGECKQGAYACVAGLFACVGGKSPTFEECDCKDNDCDGTPDNQQPGAPPLCGAGKECISSSFGCQCAVPCDLTKEFPCPGGQTCTTEVDGGASGSYCVTDPCAGGCAGKTVKDASQSVICAPAGTAADPTTCLTPPVCVCKGQSGCKDPCFGVTCGAGTVCAQRGPKAGECVLDSCWANPCAGCGKVCNLGKCAANPCAPSPCTADEECRPSADFTTPTCVPSCAKVSCPAGQACVLGQCQPTCAPACAADQACDTTQSPPSCVTDKCAPENPCTDGSFCDPVTGGCGNDPCAGVACPKGEACVRGSCFGGGGGAGGGSTGTTTGTGTTTTATSTGGAGVGGSDDKHTWGLVTGGGGCRCEVGPGAGGGSGRVAILALGLILAARRRGSRKEVAR